MAITNKFIHFNTKAKFVERYATETDDFKNKYTIFIKDTKQIWAHGGMYGGYYEFASGTDGSFTITKPKAGIEAGTETVKISIGKPANAGHADTAGEATHAGTADTATTAESANVASSARLANSATSAKKVDNKLTIKNGSNTIEYDGSAPKSIEIAAGGGTAYELTADKMSTAWGTNIVIGGSLNLTNGMHSEGNSFIGDLNTGYVLLSKTPAIQLRNTDKTLTLSLENGGGVFVPQGGAVMVNSTGTAPSSVSDYNSMMNSNGVFTKGKMNAVNGFFQTSDIRKKNFGSDVEINFEELKSIPKKYFEWKDDPNEVQQIGTSAQALLRVYPQIVSKGDDGFYSVDYAKLSIIALAAIDKLNERVEKLEAEIKSVKK